MKEYQLGMLTVIDKELQDTKEEIVIELIDRMEKYVVEGKATFENMELTKEERLHQIKSLCWRFCGLSEFLQTIMGIEIRSKDRFKYTQEMANHFFYWQTMLEIDIKKEREQDDAESEKEGQE